MPPPQVALQKRRGAPTPGEPPALAPAPPEPQAPVVPARAPALQGGVPLNAAQRAFYEPRLGAPLGQVRLHANDTAARAAEQINARAFAAGQDIFFGPGQYQPDSAAGQRLLGHELTHAAQQHNSPAGLQRDSLVSSPEDAAEREARRAGDLLAAGGALPGGIQERRAAGIFRQEPAQEKDVETPPGLTPQAGPKSKEEASWDWPWTHALRPVWEGWTKGGARGMLFDPTADPDLSYRQLAAIYNLWWAGYYTKYGPYQADFSKNLAMVEQLGGVKDTWLQLASLPLGLDLEKHLETSLGTVIEEHPLSLFLYALPLYGAIQGITAGTESDLDWFTLISTGLKKYTEAPRGFGRALQLSNVLDPRWGGTLFQTSPSGLSLAHSGQFDPSKPHTLGLTAGLNLLPMLSQYQESYDPATWKGPELYPYLKFGWDVGGEGRPQAPVAQSYFGGFFGGSEGFYGLLEAGGALRPGGDLQDFYTRQAFVLRNLAALDLLQASLETSYRPGTEEDWRFRLNLAAMLGWDWQNWRLTAGGGVGGLLPAQNLPGAMDLAATLGLYHKYYKSGSSQPFLTGLELSTMWRPEDLFDPHSGQLTSVKGKLSILDLVNLAAEYHQYAEGPKGISPATAGLPESDFRLMLNVGPGLVRWFQK